MTAAAVDLGTPLTRDQLIYLVKPNDDPELYRGGRVLLEPTFKRITAPKIFGFDSDAGVGDKGNGHALVQLVDRLLWRDQSKVVEVLPNFICDGASVPAWVWGHIDPTWLDLLVAGLLHDKLYRERSERAMILDAVTLKPRMFDRRKADKILSKAAQMDGADWGDAKAIYYGVQMGGSSSYQKKAENWSPELIAA